MDYYFEVENYQIILRVTNSMSKVVSFYFRVTKSTVKK